MKRQICKPYKMNWKPYMIIALISLITMTVSVVWGQNDNIYIFTDIIKNLSFGCFASILVAFLIEKANVKEKNENAGLMYDAIYSELMFNILFYLESWHRLCVACFKDKNYNKEKHTWYEWYELTKKEFFLLDKKDQLRLLSGIISKELLYNIENIEKAFNKIEYQQYFLYLNYLYNDDFKKIFEDLRFEFSEAKSTLEFTNDIKYFWESFDAMKLDFINYIGKWADIRYYNYLKFSSEEHFISKDNIQNAILESINDPIKK